MPDIREDEIDEQEPAIDGRSFYEDRHRIAFEAAMVLMLCAVVVVAVIVGSVAAMSAWLGKGPWY